jgi:hypothetical protein
MMTYKIIVAGSRGFTNYELLKENLDILLKNLDKNNIEILSGTAKGADRLGERYGKENNIPIKQFPADWSQGKQAGYLRNEQMAKNATHCVVFWDGESKGAKLMIDIAKRYRLELRVIKIMQNFA